MKTEALLVKVNNILEKAFKNELKLQGHSNTGRLESSIKGKVSETELEGTIFDYGQILDDGTTADKIPFRSGSGGKSSKYIDGLTAFFLSKGLGAKEAKSAAFATAKVQKKEGMSTAASKRFSKNGKRQDFIKDVIDKQDLAINKIIDNGMDNIFDSYYNKQKTETI
jgi:hypothetical protein